MTRGIDDPYAPTERGTNPLPEPASVPPPKMIGRRIGVYEILEQVGSGGMGIVYRAKDRSLDRDVALKVLQPFLAQDAEFERRFVREARTAAKLDHANIVQVYTAGRFQDVLFIAMQFVRGKTLHQLIRERGRLPWPEALGIIRQAAEALGAAHQVGLVHRDIKPNNIMLDEQGRVKIMDFGLMRSHVSGEAITQSGDFFGTPEYASPEQCETTQLDGRSDIYSLGAVLYEMLSGRMPYKAETPLALFKKILEEEPIPLRKLNPDVPHETEALVQRMMAKRPSDRFGSAGELVEAISRLLGDRETRGEAGRAATKPARGPRVLVACGLVAAAALAAVAWALFFRPSSGAPATPGSVTKAEKLKLVVFDLRSGIPHAETAWYEIALSDMLIASLAQHPFLEVPTRDQLLWKLKEMKLGERITEDNRRVLVHELGAGAYVAGTYYVRGGKVRVTLSCYRLPENVQAFPTKTFEKTEEELFALVDDAARGIARDLEGVASRVLTQVTPAPEVRPCQELAVAYRGPGTREEKAKYGPAQALPREGAERAIDSLRQDEKSAYAKETKRRDAADKVDPAGRAQAAKAPAPEEALALKKAPAAPASAPSPAAGAPAGRIAPEPAAAAPKPAFRLAERQGAEEKAPAQQEADRRKLAFPAMGEQELLKAWYQNRHALEACKFEREEFEALSRALRGQFQAGPVDAATWQQGVENFRVGIEHAREARNRGGARSVVEFACPGCAGASAEFGRCEKCDKYLILRIRVPNPEKKE